MSRPWIPLSRVSLGDAEAAAVADLIHSGGRLAGDGPIGRRIEAELGSRLGAEVFLVPSGTAALELIFLLLQIGPGDEVILPSYTFPSAANAVLLRGATPVFADVVPETLTIDPEDVARRIGPSTRALVGVHYLGVPCDLDALGRLAEDAGIPLVEDAAQALGAQWGGQPVGGRGRAGALSFHQTKAVTSGEGGAFVTRDAQLKARAEVVREKGTDRGAFLRGEVPAYTWNEPGGSYLLSELQAALLEVQLGRLDSGIEARRRRWTRYRDELTPLAEGGRLSLPTPPPRATPSGEGFFVLLPTPADRTRALQWMADRRIGAAFHHLPLHDSPQGRRLGGPALPRTEDLAARVMRLPLHAELSPDDQDRVLDAMSGFCRTL